MFRIYKDVHISANLVVYCYSSVTVTIFSEENMLWKARNYADAKLYERAQDMETPSCEQLQRLYG